MRISDILRGKGPAVATVTETTTVTALLTELEDWLLAELTELNDRALTELDDDALLTELED